MPSIQEVARENVQRMFDAWARPPEPIMTDEEYEALTGIRKAMLVCNMPGCGKCVSTHTGLCMEHATERWNKR